MIRDPFGLLFWAHCTVIAVGYFSWALFDWRLVLVGFALYYFQLAVFGDCLLTRAQFGSSPPGRPRTTFYYQYLRRLGVPVTNRQVVIVADYLLPPLAVLLALVAQLGYGLHPLWL